MNKGKVKLTTLIVALIVCGVPFNTAEAETIIRAPNNLGLVGYWSFDEGVGTQAGDLSGNRNEGALMNGPEWSIGHIGNALTFSGSEWVDLSDGGVNDIGVSGAMTISLWFWADNDNSNQYFLDNRNPGSWWFIKDYSGGPCGSIPNNICFEDRLMATDDDWDPGEWTHLVVTDDTTTATMYINGEAVDTGQGESSTISTNLRIGTRYSNSGYFQGKMDEVRLYGRALSAAEVQSLYRSSKGTLVGVVPTDKYTDGLVLHYTFDGDTLSGSTLSDLVGNSDGTLNGAVPTIGVVGQAMGFDGSSAIVDMPDGWGSGVDFTEISGATWVYPTSNLGTKGILEGRSSDFHWEITSGKWRVRLANFNVASAATASPVNEWSHIAFTYNRNTGQFRYYVNGSEVYSATGESGTGAFFASGNTQLGDSNFGTRFWQGKIDDFRIYNRELSPEEVRGLAGLANNTLASEALSDIPSAFSGWSHRKKITIQASEVDGDLTNFPVFVELGDLGGSFFSSVKSGGGDIRVTTSDGETEVPIEIVSLNAGSESGELYFKAPTLSGTVNTDFYVYYGNSGASGYAEDAQYGKENVWSNGYAAVYHMGGGQLVDSTANDNDSVSNNGVGATGVNGQATEFSGSNWAVVPHSTSIGGDIRPHLSISAWINSDSSYSNRSALEKGNQYFFLQFGGAGDQGPLIKLGGNRVANVGTVPVGQWHQVGGVFDGSAGTLKAYKDGALTGTTSGLGSQIDSSSLDLVIGADDASRRFDGKIDEVRISAAVRSNDWISTTYNNQSDPQSFYIIGEEES